MQPPKKRYFGFQTSQLGGESAGDSQASRTSSFGTGSRARRTTQQQQQPTSYDGGAFSPPSRSPNSNGRFGAAAGGMGRLAPHSGYDADEASISPFNVRYNSYADGGDGGPSSSLERGGGEDYESEATTRPPTRADGLSTVRSEEHNGHGPYASLGITAGLGANSGPFQQGGILGKYGIQQPRHSPPSPLSRATSRGGGAPKSPSEHWRSDDGAAALNDSPMGHVFLEQDRDRLLAMGYTGGALEGSGRMGGGGGPSHESSLRGGGGRYADQFHQHAGALTNVNSTSQMLRRGYSGSSGIGGPTSDANGASSSVPFREPAKQLYPYPFPHNDDERHHARAQRLKADLDHVRYGSSASPLRQPPHQLNTQQGFSSSAVGGGAAVISPEDALLLEPLMMGLKRAVVAQLGLDAPRMFELVQRQYALDERRRKADHSVARQRHMSPERSHHHDAASTPSSSELVYAPEPCDVLLRAVFSVPRSAITAYLAVAARNAASGGPLTDVEHAIKHTYRLAPMLERAHAVECGAVASASPTDDDEAGRTVATLARMCRTAVNPMNIAVQKRARMLLHFKNQNSRSPSGGRGGSPSRIAGPPLAATGDEDPHQRREFVCWASVEIIEDGQSQQHSPPPPLFSTFIVLDGAKSSSEPLWVEVPNHNDNRNSRKKGQQSNTNKSGASPNSRKSSPTNQRSSPSSSPNHAARALHGAMPSAEDSPHYDSLAAKPVISRANSEVSLIASVAQHHRDHQRKDDLVDDASNRSGVNDNKDNVSASSAAVAIRQPVAITDPHESPSGHLLSQAEMLLKQLRQHYFEPVASSSSSPQRRLPEPVVLQALNDCNVLIVKAATHMHNYAIDAGKAVFAIRDETERMKARVEHATGLRLGGGVGVGGAVTSAGGDGGDIDAMLAAASLEQLNDEASRGMLVAEMARRQRELHSDAIGTVQDELARAEARLALLEAAEEQTAAMVSYATRDMTEDARAEVGRMLAEADEERRSRLVDVGTGGRDGAIHMLFGEMIPTATGNDMTKELGYALIPLTDLDAPQQHHVALKARHDAALGESQQQVAQLTAQLQHFEERTATLEAQLTALSEEHEDYVEYVEFERAKDKRQYDTEMGALEEEFKGYREWSVGRQQALSLLESQGVQTSPLASRKASVASAGVQFEHFGGAVDVHSRSAGVTPQPSMLVRRTISRLSSRAGGGSPTLHAPCVDGASQTDLVFGDLVDEAYASAALYVERQYEDKERALQEENSALRRQLAELLAANGGQGVGGNTGSTAAAAAAVSKAVAATQCDGDDIDMWKGGVLPPSPLLTRAALAAHTKQKEAEESFAAAAAEGERKGAPAKKGTFASKGTMCVLPAHASVHTMTTPTPSGALASQTVVRMADMDAMFPITDVRGDRFVGWSGSNGPVAMDVSGNNSAAFAPTHSRPVVGVMNGAPNAPLPHQPSHLLTQHLHFAAASSSAPQQQQQAMEGSTATLPPPSPSTAGVPTPLSVSSPVETANQPHHQPNAATAAATNAILLATAWRRRRGSDAVAAPTAENLLQGTSNATSNGGGGGGADSPSAKSFHTALSHPDSPVGGDLQHQQPTQQGQTNGHSHAHHTVNYNPFMLDPPSPTVDTAAASPENNLRRPSSSSAYDTEGLVYRRRSLSPLTEADFDADMNSNRDAASRSVSANHHGAGAAGGMSAVVAKAARILGFGLSSSPAAAPINGASAAASSLRDPAVSRIEKVLADEEEAVLSGNTAAFYGLPPPPSAVEVRELDGHPTPTAFTPSVHHQQQQQQGGGGVVGGGVPTPRQPHKFGGGGMAGRLGSAAAPHAAPQFGSPSPPPSANRYLNMGATPSIGAAAGGAASTSPHQPHSSLNSGGVSAHSPTNTNGFGVTRMGGASATTPAPSAGEPSLASGPGGLRGGPRMPPGMGASQFAAAPYASPSSFAQRSAAGSVGAAMHMANGDLPRRPSAVGGPPVGFGGAQRQQQQPAVASAEPTSTTTQIFLDPRALSGGGPSAGPHGFGAARGATAPHNQFPHQQPAASQSMAMGGMGGPPSVPQSLSAARGSASLDAYRNLYVGGVHR